MRQIKYFGESSEIVSLINFADAVISVGMAFVGHMVENHGFERKHNHLML